MTRLTDDERLCVFRVRTLALRAQRAAGGAPRPDQVTRAIAPLHTAPARRAAVDVGVDGRLAIAPWELRSSSTEL